MLARLRAREPVAWLPALDGWLVTRRDLAMQVMRDAETFTVDDPRFSTAQVVGPSMLSLDGSEHRRHRDPFAPPFRLNPVRERFTALVAAETDRLIDTFAGAGDAELRRALAGPLAAIVVTHALGLDEAGPAEVLGWYDAIVASVTAITAGGAPTADGRRGFAALQAAMGPALERDPAASLVAAAAHAAGGLEHDQVVSNAAVLLFGGIETTEGMIANAVAHLLAHPAQLAAVRGDPALLPGAVEESLRLEPAAAVVDRYATRAPWSSAARGSASATSSASRSRGRTGIPPCSPSRTASTCGGPTRGCTSRSPTARTSASGCTSPGWRRTRRSGGCWTGCRGSSSIPRIRPRCGGSCSASPSRCGCAGPRRSYAGGMCRNIRTLHNFEPPASDDEVQAAALQYVRKISGSAKPSQANAAAFERAVEAVAEASRRLLDELVTAAPPKDRDVEAAKARARSAARYAA